MTLLPPDHEHRHLTWRLVGEVYLVLIGAYVCFAAVILHRPLVTPAGVALLAIGGVLLWRDPDVNR